MRAWEDVEDVIIDPEQLKVGDWIKGIGDVSSAQHRIDVVTICKAIRRQWVEQPRLYFEWAQRAADVRLRKRLEMLECLLHSIGDQIETWRENES